MSGPITLTRIVDITCEPRQLVYVHFWLSWCFYRIELSIANSHHAEIDLDAPSDDILRLYHEVEKALLELWWHHWWLRRSGNGMRLRAGRSPRIYCVFEETWGMVNGNRDDILSGYQAANIEEEAS
ncbi:hypothetical protein FN846DRAFT_1022543 [Sphaerosporella brunnea]|uniref:Uncharacterized protein n=1 Tax=Sphaerosporella brunnea TaxID=1250544 RepID=A0A5J5ES56_9PEZI|nr:hypothetical protein FN846DRAFT_1022543 [Sphaerosporella brunnea]